MGFFFVTALGSAQSVTEFAIPTAASSAFGIAAGPDGNIWFTESAANKIGRITPAGVITEFPIPTPASIPFAITSGPDGAFWFTEAGAKQVGRISVTGDSKEFPLPEHGEINIPQGIASGPDGALWVTGGGGPTGFRITRLTTSGAATEFSLFHGSENPSWITPGPDGNLWFPENNVNVNKIGRITPSGVVAEFPIPTDPSGPFSIAAGPDGNLWFVEAFSGKIGRITPAGAITEFALPSSTSAPHSIATGPDGNVWFTESSGNKIGRMTAASILTEFSIPTASSLPEGIAAGADRSLWFVEAGANKIGRIDVGPSALTITAIAPSSGSGAGGSPVAVLGTGFEVDATLMIGIQAARNVVVPDGTHASGTTPALLPGTLNDVVVTNPSDGSFGVLPKGWLSDFLDVPEAHGFHGFIEKLVRNGVTAGCGAGGYCPDAPVTRAQAAIFLLRSLHGNSFVPGPATGAIFGDVAASSFGAAWIERLFADGVSTGCGSGNYCPGDPVSRAQMAVLLLRTQSGPTYVPPAPTGMAFADVPVAGFAASWIEELARREITTGCGGGNYCPSSPVTRAQIAVFLVATFALP